MKIVYKNMEWNWWMEMQQRWTLKSQYAAGGLLEKLSEPAPLNEPAASERKLTKHAKRIHSDKQIHSKILVGILIHRKSVTAYRHTFRIGLSGLNSDFP